MKREDGIFCNTCNVTGHRPTGMREEEPMEQKAMAAAIKQRLWLLSFPEHLFYFQWLQNSTPSDMRDYKEHLMMFFSRWEEPNYRRNCSSSHPCWPMMILGRNRIYFTWVANSYKWEARGFWINASPWERSLGNFLLIEFWIWQETRVSLSSHLLLQGIHESEHRAW